MTLNEKLTLKLAEIRPVPTPEEPGQIQLPIQDEQPVSVVPTFAVTLVEAKERIRMLQEFVRDMMVPGLDYGVIPGCPKPSLLKPGAEKLCDIFGFSKQIEVISRLEDYTAGTFAYEVKATLISKRTGFIEAEGVGCCNSKERKYRTQDPFSIANTILKMAKKRALVDAVLSATRSSGLFTQDMEDIAPESPRGEITETGELATPAQLKKIYALSKEVGIPNESAKQLMSTLFQIESSTNLTKKQASEFLSHLLELKA